MPYGRENLFIQCCARYSVKFCEKDVRRSEVKSDIVCVRKEIQIRTLLGGKALCTAGRSVSDQLALNSALSVPSNFCHMCLS